MFQAYLRLLDGVDFDGVMLDRIRYPSAVNGFESLFACFCPDCEREYLAGFGAPLAEMQEAAASFLAGLAGSAYATNGYFSHGYGMKAKGMGGASTAVVFGTMGLGPDDRFPLAQARP